MLADIKGVGSATVKKLKSLDIETTEQLINYLPERYIDFNKPVLLREAEEGHFSLFKLVITKVGKPVKAKSGLNFFSAEAADADGDDRLKQKSARLTWFNQPYMLSNIKVGETYLCFGKVKFKGNKIELINPSTELFENARKLTGIMPVYRTRGAIHQGSFRAIIGEALKGFDKRGIIGEKTLKARGLPPLSEAYRKAHFPDSEKEGVEAQKRIALEDAVKEIIYYKYVNSSSENTRLIRYGKPFSVVNGFINSLPFSLTESQVAALRDIAESLSSDRKMNRLLIGDVGSGKTIVAFISMLYAVKCGYQAAILAPTEILAAQHFRTAERFFADSGLNIVFHSGSVKGAERKRVEEEIASGKADIVIGTHSIFQKNIAFKNLAVAVIDEQHKFGVAQKFSFQEKGIAADTLTLTATPIPRSVLMLLYDELQLSRIEKERTAAVTTRLVSDNKKHDLFDYIRREALKGNQAFIVCPKIYDGEGVETYGANTLFKELSEGIFADIRVALIHGKLKAAEKNAIMEAFAAGDIDALVSTTVIEVGIDIKNATVIAVLNSERFGLATLHQLRGRVGRGEKSAYCFLHTSDVSNPRLKALTECTDGFKLAELDFTLRGGGDYLGTRQSGDSDGGKYIAAVTPELILTAKEIAVKDLLPEGVLLDREDYVYYSRRFSDVTVN